MTFDGQTPTKSPSNRTDYYWEGAHYAGTQPSNLSKEVMDIMYQVKNKRLHLSRMVEWQFNNLNASFEKVVGTSKRTVIVYSDVVESSVVGSSKFPLLREVQLLRTGEGESTVEPLRHQWIKVRGHQLEIVEVEIASTSGPLAILSPWQNPGDHWPQTAIKTTTHPLGREHINVRRDARREFNALPHARGHDPRRQRVGRRVNQTRRAPDRAASPSGTARYSTRTEFGRHLGPSRRATHPRIETQSPRPGLDGRQTQGQTHRPRDL